MKETVLITGGATGIGRATSELFALMGYQVAIAANSSFAEALSLARALSERGLSAAAFRADLRDSAQVDALFSQVEKLFGGVDILINNAGIAQQKLFTDLTEEDWDRMFQVDVKGVFLCTQAVLPGMIRRQRGKIINISSMWGQVGASCEVHYSAAKGAVIAFTKALAQEVGPSHIQVNCVAPGVIATEMNGALPPEALDALREETPLGIIGQPGDIAEAVWFLASPQADFITGQVLAPNGGLVL